MDVIFLHGKESGPHGSKFMSIQAAGWRVTAPDCEGLDDLDRRVAIARAALEAVDRPCVLVGSSYGGLTAALLHDVLRRAREDMRVRGLLLLAPALHLERAADLQSCHANTRILHGTQDAVVPIAASRSFAQRFGCEMTEVADGHRLANSHAEILRLLESVAGTSPRA